ncbi:hypothetical protein E8E13_009823 [Curvularia kusanoi]|uniref:Aminoglycoside phosphotransferase domain-containing protein n=1 Tax=Curvularia kusanoi TaxID=90978 RepID=A0A9P4TF89_CURKU|nr:hypothetical protein E8E13_009823 [Curvularia kusanoi]
MEAQATLGWQTNLLSNLDMIWLKEPDTAIIEKIARRELNIPTTESCIITFLAEGCFNKVYDVQCGSDTHYIMRIALPVHPRAKVLSEVATIEYVRQHTNIPVPKILQFDASHVNELGFEWMLMDVVPGTQLNKLWKSMTWLKKELIVRKVVALMVQLFRKRFPVMGNLYPTGESNTFNTPQFRQGEVVQLTFFWANHLKFNVDRGPFLSSEQWMRVSLDLQIQAADDPVAVVPGPFDDDDEEDEDAVENEQLRAAQLINRGRRLINLLPKIFPAGEPEAFTLYHHDLHEDNIFVDENCELSGIIDWECMLTAPLWAACKIPKFLNSRKERNICPDQEGFSNEILEDGSITKNSMYFEHLEEYEKTQLRAFFLEEMQRECPEWVDIYRTSKMKVAFAEVVGALGNRWPLTVNDVGSWLDAVEKHGFAPSLSEMVRGSPC